MQVPAAGRTAAGLGAVDVPGSGGAARPRRIGRRRPAATRRSGQTGHRGGPGDVRRSHDDEGHRDEYDRQRQGRRRVAFPLQVDRQRHGARDALLGAGEGDGRPELAQTSAQSECRPPHEGRPHQRQGDTGEHCPLARAQRPGDRLSVGVARAQRRLEGHDEVGHGHEDLGDDDGGGREGDLHSQSLQGRPEHAPFAQCGQQSDAGHHRGHGHGQHGQDASDAHARPLAREKKSQRHSQNHADRGRDQTGPQRQAERPSRRIGHQQDRQLGPGHARAQPDEGQHDRAGAQERQGEHGCREAGARSARTTAGAGAACSGRTARSGRRGGDAECHGAKPGMSRGPVPARAREGGRPAPRSR